jgi:hypothetical protein
MYRSYSLVWWGSRHDSHPTQIVESILLGNTKVSGVDLMIKVYIVCYRREVGGRMRTKTVRFKDTPHGRESMHAVLSFLRACGIKYWIEEDWGEVAVTRY